MKVQHSLCPRLDEKVVEPFTDAYLTQMIGYLAITGLKVGYLLIFKQSKLKRKRLVRS